MAAAAATALLVAGVLWPATVHAAPAASAVAVPRCAASIEEAARGIIGGVGAPASAGYRVQDLVIDPVLRKAWVRVADCSDPRKPLTLVPLTATLAVGNAPFGVPLGAPFTAAAIAPSAAGMKLPSSGREADATSAAFATSPTLSTSAAFSAIPAPLSPPPAPAPVLIARGDAVQVFVQSDNVRMTLEGHAASAAAAGESLDVLLDAAPATGFEPAAPARHLRGIAAGAHRVEVQR